jgi:hypothetical protein
MSKVNIDKVLEKLVLECGSEKAKGVLEENKKLKGEIEQLRAHIDVLDRDNKALEKEVDEWARQIGEFEELRYRILAFPEDMGSLALDVKRIAEDFINATFTYTNEVREEAEHMFAKKNKKKSRR